MTTKKKSKRSPAKPSKKTASSKADLKKKPATDQGNNRRATVQKATASQVAAKKTAKVKASAQKSPIQGAEAEAQITRMLLEHAPNKTPLIHALRRSLRKLLPKSIEVVYEYPSFVVITYSPNGKGYDGILTIKASEKEVKLYFNRARELNDPNNLLKGSGTLARSIKIEALEMIKKSELLALMKQAIEKNTIPFPSRGGGSTIIQSSKEG